MEQIGWPDETPDTSDVTWVGPSRSAEAAKFRAKLKALFMRLFGLTATCWLLAIGVQGIVIGPKPDSEKIHWPTLTEQIDKLQKNRMSQ